MKEAGDATPDDLKTSNSEPRDEKVEPDAGAAVVYAYDRAGRSEGGARDHHRSEAGHPVPDVQSGAQGHAPQRDHQGGARWRAGKRLYIHGAINQDPSTSTNPVELFDHANSEKADFEVVLPAAIDEITTFWQKELKKLPGTFAMVHSKVVLVDPFSENPVLLTGSHNLGPKASGINDENLLIIRDAPGLAAAYATNIMAIYNQYRWRFRRQVQPKSKRWKGLKDDDAWQKGYLKAGSEALREIDFWVGE